MKRALKFGTSIVVLLSACVFSQTPSAERKPDGLAPARENAATDSLVTAKMGSLEILTDTPGVDFGPYLARVLHDVRENWYQLTPPSVLPPLYKEGKLSIEFLSCAYHRNSQGNISDCGLTFSDIAWGVIGRGCSGRECGTISDTGVYTAPPTVPNNPVVTVRATADADLGETVLAVVTIVPNER